MNAKTIKMYLVGMLLCIPIQSALAKIQVVTTTADLKAIVSEIGGDRVDVKSIASGNQDPHFIEAKPSFMLKTRKADLFIRIGMELEAGWEPLILKGSRNVKIQVGQTGHLDVSQGIQKLEIPVETIDRSMGDVHPFGNPHYWLNPLNVKILAESIADRLVQLDPENKNIFLENVEQFKKKMDEHLFGKDLVDTFRGDQLSSWFLQGKLEHMLQENNIIDKLGGWCGRLMAYKGTPVLTYHNSWVYFVSLFGLKVPAYVEPKAGIPPSPAHLAKLIQMIQSQNISVLLMEPYYSDQAPQLLATKTGIHILKMNNSVVPPQSYFDYMDYLVEQLASNLLKSPVRMEENND